MSGEGARLTIRNWADESADNFAEDIARGLTATEKFLRARYLYDDLGSILFEAICRLPEYYLTRAETEILTSHTDEIAAAMPRETRLLELGSGSGEKTRILIRALLQREGALDYQPIEVSALALRLSAEALLEEFTGLTIIGHHGDYFRVLESLAEEARQDETPATLLFLGSTIGNLDPASTVELFRLVRRFLRRGETFLLGADMAKPAELLVPAYDDALGVTAAFNKNLLVRINRELGGDFDLRGFDHDVVYDAELARIQMRLRSNRDQRVTLSALDLQIDFAAGETIHTENCHKYDLARIAELAAATGFEVAQTWQDSGGRFSLSALQAT